MIYKIKNNKYIFLKIKLNIVLEYLSNSYANLLISLQGVLDPFLQRESTQGDGNRSVKRLALQSRLSETQCVSGMSAICDR